MKELNKKIVNNLQSKMHSKKTICPLVPILHTMKVLGRIPFSRDDTGTFQFHVISRPMVCAVVITSVQIFLVVMIYLWHLVWIRPPANFDNIISTINELLFLNTSFHGVLATWWSTPKITRAVNRWIIFHILSGSPSADEVISLRRHWLELHACTEDLVDGFGPTLRMWKGLGFIINLFTIYGLLTIAFSGRFTDLNYLLNALLTTSVSIYITYGISDWAQTSMSSDIVITIHSAKWTHLQKDVRSQLVLLLDTVEMGKPCFEVNGMYNINKPSFIATVYAIITNLVVLMQFKVSTSST